MPKFKKKPDEKIYLPNQYTEYGKLVKGMCNSISCYQLGSTEPHLHTIHDGQICNLVVGDWIMPEPDGEHFYPIKPHIFAATYEPVSD